MGPCSCFSSWKDANELAAAAARADAAAVALFNCSAVSFAATPDKPRAHSVTARGVILRLTRDRNAMYIIVDI